MKQHRSTTGLWKNVGTLKNWHTRLIHKQQIIEVGVSVGVKLFGTTPRTP